MALSTLERQLIVVPDPRLRRKAEPVGNIDGYVRELAGFLLSQLKTLEAIGLAAPQFGEMLRLIVVSIQGREIVLVNPEVVKARGIHLCREGCRSIPNRIFEVKRPKVVKVRGLDLDGHQRGVRGHELLAQCLCHEIDHLDGKLIDKTGVEGRKVRYG